MFLPGLWKLVFRRSRRLAEKGEQDRALRLAVRYSRWRSADPHAWNFLADTLLHQGKFVQAEAALRKGFERHPNSPDLAYLLSQALMHQDRIAEARAVLEEQTRRTPDSFFPYLGKVKLEAHEESWAEMLEAADETIERIPPNWSWAKYEVALSMLRVPTARLAAERLLSDATDHLPKDEAPYAMSQVLLAVLRESSSPDDAARHLARARRYWRGPASLDEMLEFARKELAGA